jgi:predicted SnoaL-like aldol condensation-catalyzing enzyme
MPALSPKDAAVEFLSLVARGEVDAAYSQHVGAGFRHHNPWFRGDAAALREGMRANAQQQPQKTLEVKQVLQDGDRVAVLSHMVPATGEPGMALLHLFRFENGRIAELWDLGQPVPADSPNEHGMF